jgi:5S rRNA maturation endonuclease (ribonuclease M5)
MVKAPVAHLGVTGRLERDRSMPSIESILGSLNHVQRSGKGWTARCPAHDDQRNSLSVSQGDDHRILLHCHAGCRPEAIVKALGMDMRDLFPTYIPPKVESFKMQQRRNIIAIYDYNDVNGQLLCQVVRFQPKNFKQRRPGENSDWIWNLNGVPRVLYRLPELSTADLSEPVLITEGEKDVETLRTLGLVSTTNPGGAGKWQPEYDEVLRGRHVVILPDNDPVGHQHAEQVARSLLGVAASVKLIKLLGLTEKGDISDWIKAGHTREELLQLIEQTPAIRPEDLPPLLEIAQQHKEDRHNPWVHAQDAPSFLATQEKEFEGLADELLAPGAITVLSAPRGIGKTHVSHALAIALATGGNFRGKWVKPVRVLLFDRDNPGAVVKQRLRAWGAAKALNLRVLTRQNAPDLKDKSAWDHFPVADYDVLIIDSVGSTTEGITEKEGRLTTEVLATLLNLARKGLAILLLQNTTKDGSNIKGRGEWADRADILYELRDATNFTPSGQKEWWQELPPAGEAAWADKAARRKKRTTYRLAFIPSKFRLGQEPEPFCLELRLPKDEPWTLVDVTERLAKAGDETMARAQRAQQERLDQAATALLEKVFSQSTAGKPILKTEAEIFLRKELGLTQDEARQIVSDGIGKDWQLEKLPGGRGKGTPQALLPITEEDSDNSLDKETENQRSVPDKASEDHYSVGQEGSGSQSNCVINPPQDGSPEVSLLCPDRHESSDNQPKGAKGKTSDLVLPNQLPLLEDAS